MKKFENILKIIALISIILIGAVYTTSYVDEEISFNEYKKYERQIERAYLDDAISQDDYNEMMDFLLTTGYSSDGEFNEDLKSYKSMYK